MKQIVKFAAIFAILPLVAIAMVPDYIGQADAQKAEGSAGTVSPKSYGSATDEIVCGASLCSTPEGSPDPVNIGQAS